MNVPWPVLSALSHLTHRVPLFRPRLDISRISVRISGLPDELDGFCIGHISDLHVGAGNWLPLHVDEVAATLRAESPDVVVNTGDYLFHDPDIETVVKIVTRLVALPSPAVPCPRNLAIFGNHDFYVEEPSISDLRGAFTDLGVELLENSEVRVSRLGAGVSFVGLAVLLPGFQEVIHRLEHVPRPRVVLIHEPDLAERLPFGSADLVLAGHSHGAQIALPGLERWTVRRANGSRYVGGMYTVNGNPTYVNRGLGNTGLPVRFRAPPELTFIRFTR